MPAAEERPADAGEQLPYVVLETDRLRPGESISLSPAVLLLNLSEVLVALARGQHVVVIGSSQSSRGSSLGESCNANEDDPRPA
jgi:hypothetical protein